MDVESVYVGFDENVDDNARDAGRDGERADGCHAFDNDEVQIVLKSVLELRQRGREIQLMLAGWRGLLMNVPMRRWERAQVMKQESAMKILGFKRALTLRVVLRGWRRTVGSSTSS